MGTELLPPAPCVVALAVDARWAAVLDKLPPPAACDLRLVMFYEKRTHQISVLGTCTNSWHKM